MQLQKPVLVHELRQKLSPQMIQSIKLMTLPVQDLAERIQEEIQSNPAIEVVEEHPSQIRELFPSGASEEAEYFESSSDSGYQESRDTEDGDSKRMFLEGTVSRMETLQEHLLWQLRVQPIPDHNRAIGEVLIQNLDHDGFHKEPPEYVFPKERPETVAEVARLIQRLDPPGTCVTGFRESLIVQATMVDGHEVAVAIIRDHLDLVEKGKVSELAKRLKISTEEAEEAIAFIKTLNPFPGRAYSAEETRLVVPDVLVKVKDGDFVIVVNDEEIPVLGINPFFTELSGKGKADAETKTYVAQSIRDARHFIHGIQQRNHTLKKVAKAIVEFQRDFFMRGPRWLKPLTLKDIAAEVGVHETTVSRIANNKYAQTEWGIFPIKYFFSNSISGAGSKGSRFSKEGVKQILREIIENETEPMSDQDIANLLARRGIPIARRTVAKYRTELRMSTSFDR